MADAIYQPNTMETFHKHIFLWWKSRGVIYSFYNDFNGEGGFQGWWTDLYKRAQKFRDDLGLKPQQASVNPKAEQKIRENGNFQPFSDYDDCLMLLIRGVIKYNCMRGSQEVCE